jgi:phage gp29-like protein
MSTILGPDGRPIDIQAALRAADEPQTAALGAIQREFQRHPARGMTPARLASLMDRAEEGDLARQAELAADMLERDGHIFAESSKRRGAITALEWSIEEPDKPSAAEKALTERVREWVSLLTCDADGVLGGPEQMLAAMTSAVVPGFAPIELVWNLVADSTGRQVRIPHGTLQPREWFTSSSDRRRLVLRSNTQLMPATGPGGVHPPAMGVELKPLAWLLHVHPAASGYPARTPLARILFWPYLFKNYAVRDFSEFLEIYGLPLRIGKYPSGAGDDEKRALLQAVTQIGHNAAGIIPQGMALEFQAAAAGTEVPFAALWDRLDAVQSKVILGQTLTASEGQHGTQALGKVHNDVRMDIRDADARLYESSFTRQIIAPLVMLNEPGANPRRLPRLVIDTGQAEDLGAYADNLPKLAKAGLRIGKKWVHSKLRIPEPEDGEDVLEAAEPPPAGALPGEPGAPGRPGGPGGPGGRPAPRRGLDSVTESSREQRQGLAARMVMQALAAQAADGTTPDLIDQAVDELVQEWQPALGPLVEPVLAELEKALARGETVEAFAARIPQLVGQLDAQALTDVLARAAYSARLAGEAGLLLQPDEEIPQ